MKRLPRFADLVNGQAGAPARTVKEGRPNFFANDPMLKPYTACALVGLAACAAGPINGQPPQDSRHSHRLEQGTQWELTGMESVRPARLRCDVQSELLVWWLRSGRLPPLVTTGPTGVLGDPGTIVAYGDEKIDTNRHLGARLIVTGWLDDVGDDGGGLGLRCGFFFVERNSRNYQAESPGTLLLTRPFFNAQSGELDSELLAGQGNQGELRAGGFDGLSKIELFGEETALVTPILAREEARLDLVAGGYFLQMRERLDLKASSRVPADASLFGVADRFRVQDRFYGGQIGLIGELALGRLFLEARSIVAVGANDRVVKTRAERVAHTIAGRDNVPLGFLVQPSNLGSFRDTKADWVCELGVNLGYEVADWLRVHAGYTLIRWENTIRAGDQIDLAIDPGQTTPHPAVSFREDYFWAQGVNVGLELRW